MLFRSKFFGVMGDESRTSPAGMNDGGVDIGGPMAVAELLGKACESVSCGNDARGVMQKYTFVESKSAGLCGSVVGDVRQGHKAGGTGDSDDMALVVLDHVRQESLACIPVREQIDPENLVQMFRTSVENGMRGANARIVDQDRRLTQGGPDLVCCTVDGIRVGDVAVLEENIC